MFDLKHRCPYCRLLPDSTTDHDHFLTCHHSKKQKDTRITTLNNRLDRLNTPPSLRNMILHHVNNYYNNDLLPDLITTPTNLILDDCIKKQTIIGWEHFIRGRLTLSFHPILNKYYRSNKLGRRFKSATWYRTIIRALWQLHQQAWLDYCNIIHTPPKSTTLPSPAKITLLALVEKYILESSILPKHKKLFFACTKLQYRKWSTHELQRWLSTARKIIQRYKMNLNKKVRTKQNPTSTSTIDTNNTIRAPTTPLNHLFIKDKKTNHFKNTTINK